MSSVDLQEQFPVGSKVRDSRYGEVEFEVVDYWRGDLRLKVPSLGTTHCCPLSMATIAAPRTVGVEVDEPAAHIRRFGLVTLTLDNAENLVAVLTT